MPDAPAYASSPEVLADRIAWARLVLAHLVDRGRAEGWLDGARVAPGDLDPIETEIAKRIAATPPDPTIVPMEWMALRLGLAADELAALWLLACVEVSPALTRLAQACSAPDAELTIQLVRLVLALSDASLDELERRGLIVVAQSNHGYSRRALRAHDRVVALARGEIELDRELPGVALSWSTTTDSCATPSALKTALRADPAPFVMVVGPEGAGRATLLAAAAADVAKGTLRIRTSDLSRDPSILQRQLRAVLREACLFNVIPMFEGLTARGDCSATAVLERELRDFAGPVMATVTEPIRFDARPVVVHPLVKPDAATRCRQWRAALPEADVHVLDEAARKYTLWPGAIGSAAHNARAIAGCGGITSDSIHAGVRAHLGDQMAGLAHRVECRQTWNDVVLPRDQFDQLIELVARVRRRSQVLETWGFGDKIGKGNGVAALFSGPPGTGKTMFASLLAQELGMDLYQVDLSKIVSKYIGETEKQLATLFDAAETGQALILFDEADSLFAKRTEVKSSNDRYANLEVNYLLQRLEAFTGVALLTTNHERSIDEAFRRRIAVHVRFPMPEEGQRAELWRALLPASADVADDIDAVELARNFELSGGYIKNAVLRAAYVAADQGCAITMAHLWRAARAEYESLGKIAHQRAA
jgi:hypothetical protein